MQRVFNLPENSSLPSLLYSLKNCLENCLGEAYMSLPGGKALYLRAFIFPLSYIRKLTDLCPPAQLIVFFC
nr:MAG TPA: hypothetical protein [Microviridae sp.]